MLFSAFSWNVPTKIGRGVMKREVGSGGDQQLLSYAQNWNVPTKNDRLGVRP
jgi:hypothetical protein